MKRVYTTSDQVMHLWANQSQSDARCANVYFSGNSIYSYGAHYELGRLITVRGHTVALINNSGYSVTTSKHIRQAWDAVSHLPRLKSTNLTIETGLLETQDDLINGFFDKFTNRKYTSYSTILFDDYLVTSIKEFNNFCDLVGKKQYKLDLNREWINLYNNHVTLYIERADNPELIFKKQQLQLKRAEAEIQAWRNYGPITSAVRALEPQLLRTRIDDGSEVVETSRGAIVPAPIARAVLKRILNKDKKLIGTAIGSFTLTKVTTSAVPGDSAIIHIGCHKINLEEAKQVLGESN